MTEKYDSDDVVETYDATQNEEDFLNFTDLDGNPQQPLTDVERSEMYPSQFITVGAKTVEIYHEKLGTLWACHFVEGGQLPKELSGRWTNIDDAVIAVNRYKQIKEQQ